ncbi:MAG: 4Fe-4S dicluster domain-containing protein [Thermoplasmatota archaeon]
MERIDTAELDPNFKFEVARQEGGKGILKCFACGSCTARCPEQEVNEDWNPRVVIRKALLGMREEVFTSEFIWICSSHYTCLEKCPQGVNVKAVMNQIREERLKEEAEEERSGETAKKRMDMTFKYKIAESEAGKDIYECFSCGTCTAGCPERDLDPLYSPRKVIKGSLLGMKDKVFTNRFVEICSTHYRCLEECPQGVKIPELMYAIRELAIKEGYTREGAHGR